jgi:hypothetical protein
MRIGASRVTGQFRDPNGFNSVGDLVKTFIIPGFTIPRPTPQVLEQSLMDLQEIALGRLMLGLSF